MFDTHIHKTAAPYPQQVNILCKNAPTDESVRLLKEMEEKAREKIIDSMVLEVNHFKCAICVYQSIDKWGGITADMKVSINGIEHRFSFDLLSHIRGHDSHELGTKVRECLTKVIMREVLPDVAEGLLRQIGTR